MPTDWAEPALGLPLPPRVRRHDGDSCRNRRRTLRCTLCIPFGSSALSSRCIGTRSSRLAVVMHDRPARTEFYHVQRTFATRDQVPARQQDDLARRRETKETFGRWLVFRGCRWDGGRVSVSVELGSRWGSGGLSRGGRVRRKTVDLVQMERVHANLGIGTRSERDHTSDIP